MAAVLLCVMPTGCSSVQQILGAGDGEESQADLGSVLSWARQPKGTHLSRQTIAVLERAQYSRQATEGEWCVGMILSITRSHFLTLRQT